MFPETGVENGCCVMNRSALPVTCFPCPSLRERMNDAIEFKHIISYCLMVTLRCVCVRVCVCVCVCV